MEQSLSAHYALLLGLDDSWKVSEVRLEMADKRIAIRLEHVGGSLTCPGCGGACARHDLAPERTWRHLDTMQFETVLTARVPRANCKACGVKTCTVPWAGKQSPFTWLFEAFAVEVLKASRCVEAASKVLRLSWTGTHAIIERSPWTCGPLSFRRRERNCRARRWFSTVSTSASTWERRWTRCAEANTSSWPGRATSDWRARVTTGCGARRRSARTSGRNSPR